MPMIKTNAVHLHFKETGSKSGPSLVFSNSLGTDFRVWDALVALLKDRYRILLYDKRGHGLSDCPPPPYEMVDHIEDLASLMHALDYRDAIVCGLSVGGQIAQGLSYAHSELVRGLVLADTAHKIGTRQLWNERIAAVEEGGIGSLAEAILERWFSVDVRTSRTAELAGWRHMLVRTPADGYIGTSAALRDADLTPI